MRIILNFCDYSCETSDKTFSSRTIDSDLGEKLLTPRAARAYDPDRSCFARWAK